MTYTHHDTTYVNTYIAAHTGTYDTIATSVKFDGTQTLGFIIVFVIVIYLAPHRVYRLRKQLKFYVL